MALDKLCRDNMARVLTANFNEKYITAQEKNDLLLRSLEVKFKPVWYIEFFLNELFHNRTCLRLLAKASNFRCTPPREKSMHTYMKINQQVYSDAMQHKIKKMRL